MAKQLVLLVLLALAGWFGMGDAQAACTKTGGTDPDSQWSCTYPSEAKAKVEALMAAVPATWLSGRCTPNTIGSKTVKLNSSPGSAYVGHVVSTSGCDWPTGQAIWTTNDCATKAPLVGVFVSAASTGGKYCSFGCEYSGTNKMDVELNPGNPNAISVKTTTGAAATGAVCDDSNKTPPNPPPSPQCLVVGSSSAGNITQCYDDGKVCVYNGAKKIGCSNPGSTAPQITGDTAQTSNGQPPTTPAPNGNTWAKVTDTTHTSDDGSGVTPHTTSNWDGSGVPSGACRKPGDLGGAGLPECPSTGTCGGAGQPSCPPASTCGGAGQPACPNGNTSAGGSTCASPPVSGGDPLLSQIAYQAWAARCLGGNTPGDAGAGLVEGDFYTTDPAKTISSVYAAFKTRMSAAPVIHSADAFFSVSSGGSCPPFSVPETAYWPQMDFTYHCSGVLADALAAGGYVLLALAAWAAFKIALY